MKIRKAKMIEAIDKILADHQQRTQAWEKAVEQWKRERLTAWKRDELPRFKKLQTLIAAKARGKEPITHDELLAIFPNPDRYYSDQPRIKGFHPDAEPQAGSVKLANGTTVHKPTGVNIHQMSSMRKLLEAIEDDCVTDNQLSRLGVKDVTPIFRHAAELGGLVG